MGDIHFLTEVHLGVGEPQADIVSLLEKLLEEAKRGEIIGFCSASVRGNNSRVTDVAAGCCDIDSMVMGVLALENRVKRVYFSMIETLPDRTT